MVEANIKDREIEASRNMIYLIVIWTKLRKAIYLVMKIVQVKRNQAQTGELVSRQAGSTNVHGVSLCCLYMAAIFVLQ